MDFNIAVCLARTWRGLSPSRNTQRPWYCAYYITPEGGWPQPGGFYFVGSANPAEAETEAAKLVKNEAWDTSGVTFRVRPTYFWESATYSAVGNDPKPASPVSQNGRVTSPRFKTERVTN